MLSCKEAMRLVSEQLDRKLPLRQRLSLRFHVLMCRACSRYKHQITTLNQSINHRYREGPPSLQHADLPENSLQQIKAALRDMKPDQKSSDTM